MMHLTREEREAKLKLLAQLEGYSDLDQMLCTTASSGRSAWNATLRMKASRMPGPIMRQLRQADRRELPGARGLI
jgi:hypothetical protein